MRTHSLWMLVLLAGCPYQRLLPDQVAMGVGRLTVRNSGTLVSVLSSDSACGFASTSVLATPTLSGELGAEGTATWTVTDCTLDFGDVHELAKDCREVATLIGGKATVRSATKTVRGILTGNPQNPVIPTTADAVDIEVDATLDGFEVRSTDSDASMKMLSGEVAFAAHPHLAISIEKQVCGVATKDITIDHIRYTDASLSVTSGGSTFEVPVLTSDLSAQVGRWGERENALAGSVVVWDRPVTVPTKNDKDELDPEYDRTRFEDAFLCTADLQLPISYECPDIYPRLAEGASRLTVSLFGNLASAVDKDTDCGFSSPTVKGSPALTGELGRAGGSATFVISQPCTVRFDAPFDLATDCNGRITRVQGTAVVTGTKRLEGIRTGDAAEPIVPMNRSPATISLEAQLTDFEVSTSDSDKKLKALSGTLSGTMRPRVARSTTSGACSVSIPVVTFESLQWTDAVLLLGVSGNNIRLPVQTATLDAQSGATEQQTNHLTGSMRVAGRDVSVPLDASQPVLDPDYEAAAYLATYSCAPNMEIPPDDASCSFHRVLAQNAGRLTIRTIGTLTTLVNTDSGCGFANTFKKLDPDEVIGDPGERGSMTWSVQNCEYSYDPEEEFQTDCLGGELWVGGSAMIDARRTVTGMRETQLLFVDSIVPDTRQAVEVTLTEVQLDEFAAYYREPVTGEVKGRLVFHAGSLTAVVQPVLGERADEAGVYDISAPVSASTSHVQATLRNVDATLFAGAKIFRLTIPVATLESWSGNYRGNSNRLRGSVQVNGETVALDDIPLDPAFDQAVFDSRYECVENLMEPIPPNG